MPKLEDNRDYSKLTMMIEATHHEVFGNGREGILQTVIRLTEKVDTITKIVENQNATIDKILENTSCMKTAIAAVEKCQADMDAWRCDHERVIEKERELADRKKDRIIDLRNTRTSILLYAIMVIFTVVNILKLVKDKNDDVINPRIEMRRGQ